VSPSTLKGLSALPEFVIADARTPPSACVNVCRSFSWRRKSWCRGIKLISRSVDTIEGEGDANDSAGRAKRRVRSADGNGENILVVSIVGDCVQRCSIVE
jgi:hypothetical protein